MQFKNIILASMVASVAVANQAPEPVKRDDNVYSSIASVFENVYGIQSLPTNIATLASLASVLLTAANAEATDPAYKSAESSIIAAVPSSVGASMSASGIAPFTVTDAPAWYSSLPTNLQSYVVSQQSLARSIITAALKETNAKEGSGAAATASGNWAPRVTGEAFVGMLAAVGVGAVALL